MGLSSISSLSIVFSYLILQKVVVVIWRHKDLPVVPDFIKVTSLEEITVEDHVQIMPTKNVVHVIDVEPLAAGQLELLS